MAAWKVVSGVLSVLISLLVLPQSILLMFGNIVAGNGQMSGAAGVVVAAALLSGGVVSVASRGGSRTGDVAMSLLYGLGALVGFALAGNSVDLVVWSLWSLLCLFLALLDLAIRTSASEEGEKPAPPPPTPPKEDPRAAIPLRLVLMEQDQKKREAMIDLLPEEEAKGYLKQVLAAFISHKSLEPAGRGGIWKIIGVILLLLLLAAAGAAAYYYLSPRLELLNWNISL